MSEVIEHELALIGATPVSQEAPCGESARYEPEFEQLEAEMSKLESLKGESVDWKAVVKLSSTILQNKSKDLLVAVYLCQGLLQTEGYRGFSVGLRIINDMVNSYWEPMFPTVKRLRARKVAVEWISDKASQYLGLHAPTDKDNDSIVQSAQTARELDGYLAEKMGNDAPAMTELTRPLKQFREAIKQQQAKKSQETSVPPSTTEQNTSKSPQSESSQPSNRPSVETASTKTQQVSASKPLYSESLQINVDSDADARKSLRNIQDGIRKIAGFYNKSKLSDPRSFRLVRTAVWLTIDQIPPNKDGLTQVPAPPADKRKMLSALYDQSQFSTLLVDAELLVSKSAFWLDGQRLVANALKSMGAEYASARDVVIDELKKFIKRVPGVVNLKFADGTPFADDATKMWIESEVTASSASASSEQKTLSQDILPWQAALSESKSLIASGKTDAAVQKLCVEISRACDIRQEFYWRTTLAEVLLQSGNVNVAIQILEQMMGKVEHKQLEDWESELVVPIYRRLYEAYQKVLSKKKGDSLLSSKMESVYSKLCWLDPRMAITVKGD